MSVNILEELFSLKGQTALVTGGYRGIGLLFADTYAAAGANVVLAARNSEGCREAAGNLSAKFGIRAKGIAMDVGDADRVDQAVREGISEFGAIDILVNSAGIPGSQKPVLKMTEADLGSVMDIDFKGIFLVSKAVSEHMVKRKSGRIINIASILGKIAARNMSGYCASKAAVIQLTKVMALELIRDNIQVNVLCPGYFLTEFNRAFFDSEQGKALVREKIPLNRVGNLEELRSTALYMATCPSFLTGAEICIDGGQIIP